MTEIRNDQLSPEFYEDMYSQRTDKALLHLLDIHIAEDLNETPNVYHYTDNYSPVEFNDGTNSVMYQPAAFKITLGADEVSGTPTVSLTFDSGDRDTIRRIRRSEGNPFITLSLVLAPRGTSTVVDYLEWGPTEFELQDVEFKSTALSARLVVEPFLNEPAPATKMTPRLAPALWSNRTVNG